MGCSKMTTKDPQKTLNHIQKLVEIINMYVPIWEMLRLHNKNVMNMY